MYYWLDPHQNMLAHHGTSTENTILEQVQRRAARFVTKTYSRDEGCVSQDNYSSIYIGQPQEANSKVMHGLQNT